MKRSAGCCPMCTRDLRSIARDIGNESSEIDTGVVDDNGADVLLQPVGTVDGIDGRAEGPGVGTQVLQPGVDGLGFQGEDAEGALMDAAQGFTAGEALQALDAQGEFAGGEGAFGTDVAG